MSLGQGSEFYKKKLQLGPRGEEAAVATMDSIPSLFRIVSSLGHTLYIYIDVYAVKKNLAAALYPFTSPV